MITSCRSKLGKVSFEKYYTKPSISCKSNGVSDLFLWFKNEIFTNFKTTETILNWLQ